MCLPLMYKLVSHSDQGVEKRIQTLCIQLERSYYNSIRPALKVFHVVD